MAPQKYLARNHRFSITEDESYQTATWTTISGVNAWSWSEDSADADSSDFENSGWTSSFVVTRGATLGIEGQYLIDEVNGTKDAGQLIAETAAHDFGPSGFRWVRVQALNTARDTAIGSIIVQASIKMGEGGGGMEDINPFSLECLVQGKPVGSGIYNIFNL
jgi:hypothetical protein